MLRWRFLIFNLLLTSCSLCSIAQNQAKHPSEFSLEEAVNYAIQNSIPAENSRLNAAISKNRALEVVTQGLPKISGKFEYNNYFQIPTTIIPNFFSQVDSNLIPILGEDIPTGDSIEAQFGASHVADFALEWTQLVIDGRYFVGLKARQGVIKLADKQHELNLIGIKENVTKAYYAALIASESKTILQSNLETLENVLYETKVMYENGLAEELDVDRLELSLSNLQTRIHQTETNADNAMNALKFHIGLDLKNEIQLSETLSNLLIFSPELNAAVAPENRIEHSILKTLVDLRKYDITQVQAGYFPSIFAFANYGFNAQRDKFNFFKKGNWFRTGIVGFSINVPIFDGLEKHAAIQKRKLELQERKNNLENFQRSMDLEVRSSNSSFANSHNTYLDQKKNLELAEKIHSKLLIMYQEGVGSSFELAEAKSELINTQLNYLQSVHNLLIAKTSLEKALGKL